VAPAEPVYDVDADAVVGPEKVAYADDERAHGMGSGLGDILVRVWGNPYIKGAMFLTSCEIYTTNSVVDVTRRMCEWKSGRYRYP
jgi:hypothetical protein